MANHTDGLPAGIQRVERIQRGVQRFAIKRTEARRGTKNQCAFMADQIADNASASAADQKLCRLITFAYRARRRPRCVSTTFQFQRVAGFALQ